MVNGQRRRRWDRHVGGRRSGGARRRVRHRAQPGRAVSSPIRRCWWSASSPPHGISRCRFSARPTAGSWRWGADCSVQRRHQKLAEESPRQPSARSSAERLRAIAVAAGEAVGYRQRRHGRAAAGHRDRRRWFLEMNTRLQVEHPVTEMVTGLDLVAEQLRIAAGLEPTFRQRAVHGSQVHALELRVYAEDPQRFRRGRAPSPAGKSPTARAHPGGRRVSGRQQVTPFYDPLLAKLVVWATPARRCSPGPERPWRPSTSRGQRTTCRSSSSCSPSTSSSAATTPPGSSGGCAPSPRRSTAISASRRSHRPRPPRSDDTSPSASAITGTLHLHRFQDHQRVPVGHLIALGDEHPSRRSRSTPERTSAMDPPAVAICIRSAPADLDGIQPESRAATRRCLACASRPACRAGWWTRRSRSPAWMVPCWYSAIRCWSKVCIP